MTQHTPKWIWYPGDFELYHNMLLHARREEHGYSYGCMWHLPRPEYICQFYKTCTIPHDTTLFAAIKGEGYLSIDNYKCQKYDFFSAKNKLISLPWNG